jgi:hypothetical protein
VLDASKVGLGERIAGASAVALFIIMFLPWYGAKVNLNIPGASGNVSGSADAWEAFSFIDILLFLVVALTLAIVAATAADALPRDLPAPPGLIIAGAGGLAVLLILFRILSTPGPDTSFSDQIDITRKIGVFLGLIAAGGIAYGGWTAANEAPSGAAPRAGGPATPPPAAPPPQPPAG